MRPLVNGPARRWSGGGEAGEVGDVLEEDAHMGHGFGAHQALVHVGVEGEFLDVLVLADRDEALAAVVGARTRSAA